MTESEAIKMLVQGDEDPDTVDFTYDEYCEAIEMGRKALEMQDKLKQWIANYKNPEFKDVMITRDGLISILEEFRLECEKPMKEVTVVMNIQATKILKNVPECFGMDKETLKEQTIFEMKNEGYDDVVVSDMKVFEGGAE